MWNVWKGTLHCNWVELTQSKISWIQILPSGQAASLYRLIFMRQKYTVMLRNIHLWRPTKKINGRMYIIGSDVKCEVCGKKHYNAIELKWHKAKFHGCCPTLQVNFHEAEINWYVKEPPFMTPNKRINGRMYIIGSNVKCVERNITMQLSWSDTKQNFINSNSAFLLSCQAALFYRLIFMRQI